MEKDKEEQVCAYLIPERVTTKPKVTCSIDDTPAPEVCPDRASKTLPEGLNIHDSGIPDAGLGVFAVADFEEGTCFGPYEGEKVDKIAGYKSGYAWEIRSDEGQGEIIHCVDAQDKSKSNWMRFVNCACKESEQNLKSYQDGDSIYYLAYKPIPAGTELLTFYGEEYSRKLGIVTKPSTVATGDTHLCNICGQLLTSVEFLSRHLKYVHQSRYDVPSVYNMNADVSDYLKAVKQGKDLLEQAVNQPDTSINVSTPKEAPRKSRASSSQRAIKSTRPSKAPSKQSDDPILLDEDDDEDDGKQSSWSLKADSDDDISDAAAPDPVVCTWFEDVQDWAEGLIDLDDREGDGVSEKSRDKSSPEQPENELDWHLCHECGQLFDEEELLEIHVAARHTSGGQSIKGKEATPSMKDNDKTKDSSKPGTRRISVEEREKAKKQGTGETAEKREGDGSGRSGNIFDKFGPMLGKKRSSKSADRSAVAQDLVKNAALRENEINSSNGSINKSDLMTLNGHDQPNVDTGIDVNMMQDETVGQHSNVESHAQNIEDIIQVEDTADSDQMEVNSRYALEDGFNFDENIDKEYVEVISVDAGDVEEVNEGIGSTSHTLSRQKIEEGMSQQVWRQYICNICRKACHNKQALEEHQKTHTLFQCSTCFVSFLDKESLTQHQIEEHNERRFFCATCGNSYKSKFSLKEHEYSHTGHRPFVCPYCPKGFIRNKKLKLHIKKDHKKLIDAARKPPPPPLVLAQNNQFESFSADSDMDNYNCKFCSFEFFDREELEEHESNCEKATMITLSDRRSEEFKCEICSRSYPSRSRLERHRRVHEIYGNASSVSASSAASSPRGSDAIDDSALEGGTFPEKISSPRPFKCQLCESTFMEESHLQIHVEIHSMDGPWACVICNRKLKQRAHLLEHVYIHWEYKPFVCLYCPLDFMRAYDAEKHMKSHMQPPNKQEHHEQLGDSSRAGEVDESQASILQSLLTKPHTHNDLLSSTIDEQNDDFTNKEMGDFHPSEAPLLVTPLRCPDDGKNRPFACELCDRAFTAKSSLREHLFLHFGKPYPCDFCERQFTRKAYLISHMKEMHPEADTSAVEDSVLDAKYEELINKALDRNQTADQKKAAQPDMGINSDRPFTCKVCGKSFEFSATLKKHMQAHIKLKPLLCDFCERRFVRQSYLDDHIRTQHPPGSRSKDPNKPFKCEICDLAFSKRSYLKDHRFRHKLKKPFPCSFCSKSFRRRCLLLLHISRHHPNEHQQVAPNKPRTVPASQFPGTNTLKIKLPFQKQKSAADNPSLNRDPLMCYECGTTFSSIANVRRHMRIHSGERPFTCKFCPWSFNRKEVWKGHMKKKHAEELRAAKNKGVPQPGKIKTEGFNCHKCGGSFKSSYALSVHLKQHSQGSSTRPFKCSYCDLAFIRQSDRTKHLKFVHGLDPAEINAGIEVKVEPGITPPASTSQSVTLPSELHVCHRCGARFDSFWGLESHSRVHEKHSRFPRPYRCIECGAAFKGLSNHTRHMRVHAPDYILETKRLLNEMPGRKSRVQTSTTLVPEKPPEVAQNEGPFSSGKEARRHVCPKCGTSYKYARNLRKHIPRHIKSSDRPFQCKVCGIYGKTKTSITKHSQIHGPQAGPSTSTNTASYACQKCGDAFSTKQELLKHLASHAQSVSSQSTFKCKYCSAAFKHRGSLTIHEHSHSKLNFGFKREKSHVIESEDILRNGNKQVYVIRGLQCPVCQKTFTRRSGVSNHKKVHPDVEFVWEGELMSSVDMTSDKPYQCRICLMRFMRRSGLSNHMHSHRIKPRKGKSSPVKTPIKVKEESDGFLLSTENEEVTPNAAERPFSCEQCLCTFKTKGSLTTHTKVHSHADQDQRNHVCDICHCRFISSTNLKKHQRVHAGQPGTPVHDDPATMYSALEHSESIDIKTKRPFRCRLCGETFKAKHLLDDHIQVHSISPRQFKQKEQGLQGGWSAKLPENSGEKFLDMGDRPFRCPICGDKFRLRSTKYKHMRLHKQSAGKPYKCVECGLGFYSVGNMTKHLRRAHHKFSNSVEDEPIAEILDSYKIAPEPAPEPVPSPVNSPSRSSKTRPFACKYCGDTFTMRCNMNRHRKRHETGDNLPFRCTHCGFGFKSTKERTKHIMRVHNEDPRDNVTPDLRKPIRTGLKTYKCPICGDNFTDSSGIYKHLRVHARSANKPYRCEVCKIGYNTMVGLSRHRGRVKHFGSADGNDAGTSTSTPPQRDIKPSLSSLQAGVRKSMHKCHYCPATYKDRSSVWRHERVHKLGVSNSRPFSCKTCGFACYTKSHLERHIQMHRRAPGFTDLQARKKQISDRCKRCGLSFRTKSLYLVHMKRCSGSSTFVCKICSVTFSNQIMLTKHVRQDHGGLQRDVINLGGRRIIRETGHDKKFCCDQCDQRYKRPSELEKHLRRHALGFIRPQDGFTPPVMKQEDIEDGNMESMPEGDTEDLPKEDTIDKTDLPPQVELPNTSASEWAMPAGRTPVHNRTTKSDRARPYVCQTCGFAFMTVIHLRKHTQLHKLAHTKPFVCKICTLGYTRLLDYHRHCNVVHPWGKGYQHEIRCPRCKEKFETKSDLVEHLEKQTCKFVDDLPEVETNKQEGNEAGETATSTTDGTETTATNQATGNKNLVCPICNYQFLAKPHLETHMKVHDNWENQPFRCERCQIGYSTKQHLSKHVNMNVLCIKLAKEKERKRKLDEENNFDYGSTDFAAEPAENAQPELSMGGKPKNHVCHLCNKSFVKRGQLRVHLELHKPSPDRPHVCPKCGMGYKTISNYAKHMKWEHSRPGNSSQAKLTAAIFMCRDCGYSVTKKSLLEEHTRFGCPKKKTNPATQGPQACPVCGNYFNSFAMLCIHIHEHVYHKLFKCSQCPLRFASPEERRKHELNHPDWNNMLLELLSSEFNRKLNPEDRPGIHVKTEPGLEEDITAPFIPQSVQLPEPSPGVVVVKPEPVDEPEYNYDLGSLQDSALGDYQALLPDTSDNLLPSILQQTRRPEGSSSASRLEKIVSNLAAQKPSSDYRSSASSGFLSGSSLDLQRRPSEENRMSTDVTASDLAPSTSFTQATKSVSGVSTSVTCTDSIPDSESLVKQVAEILPSFSPRSSEKQPSNVDTPKQAVEQKAAPKQKLFRCRYCPSAFRLKGLCMAHERQSHRKIYSKASGNNKRPLKDVSKMSVCNICNAVFEQHSSLSRHMLFKHGVALKPKEPAEEDIAQEKVGKVASDSRGDNGNESDGPYITNITSQGNLQNDSTQFRQPSLLQQRLEAPLSPSVVLPSYSEQPLSRLESLLTASPSSSNHSSLLTPGELDYRPYRCHRCNFAFTQRHHLVRHIKRDSCAFHVLGRKAAAQLKESDTGHKPSPKNVQGMKIKVAEKKHKCTKCPRAFWKRIRLENHMKVHHGEGLFHCQFCAKEYKLKVDCSDHEESCPFGPGAMDALDNLNGEGDLGYDLDMDFNQNEDLDLGPDEELERAQEQAFTEDQNMDFGYDNSNHLGTSLGGNDGEDDQQWMGIQIKQEPLDL